MKRMNSWMDAVLIHVMDLRGGGSRIVGKDSPVAYGK